MLCERFLNPQAAAVQKGFKKSPSRPAARQTLRMPLDAPYRKNLVKKGFYNAVRRPLDGAELLSQPLYSLVMGAVDKGTVSAQLR